MTLSIPGIFASMGDAAQPTPLSPEQPDAAQVGSTAGCRAGILDGHLAIDQQGLLSAVCGNYYWHDREISDTALRHGPEAALALAYRRHGEKLLEQIAGRFCLLVWDANSRTGLAATDRFGIMPMYWQHNAGQTCLGATANQVLTLAGMAPEIDPQGIYNYLFFHMVPSPGSIYRSLHKLPAAHALRLSADRPEPFCYWQPMFHETRQQSAGDSGREMLQLLQSAIGQLDGGSDTGAFLSGGLDSSTVSGLLARLRPQPDTFSIGFDAEGYDEISYARLASGHFGTRGHEYYVTPEDVLQALPEVAAAYDEPFGNSSAIPAYFCARLAAENGMQRLLAGDGGDELFAGNERYAKQSLFEAYWKLPETLRKRIVQPLSGRAPASGVLAKAASYVRQASIPLPQRLHTYNFLTRFPHQEIFNPDFLRSVDTSQPFALEDAVYHRPEQASRLSRMLYLDWQFTLADNDLRKVSRMGQLAGIQVEYPMLDDLVVAQSTRIPSWHKLRFNQLRAHYKKSVAELLPARIINKSKHGFGLPFGVWMSTHPGLQALARDNLTALRQRHIVTPAFIDQLLKLHDSAHASYYGEMIWLLLMLELWLAQHGL